ncbi:MAG: serine/threonine protein kinase [Planctomycetota bacterium]|jgi:serine/threonine protein kinase
MAGIFSILMFCFVVTLAILAIIFLVVPVFRGLGWMIGRFFAAIGWLIRHVFEFIAGMLTDTVRFVGSIIAWVVLLPLVLVNVIIGRWSGAGHFARSMKRESSVAGTCLYRVVLQRPLRFLLLGGLLEGVEERVNEAVDAAPTADRPRRRAGAFDGYTIVGSLPGGGSGAKLYIAEPDHDRRARAKMPDRVVIKSFALTDGSTLPQIVRESRSLEAAKQMGLVLDHGMDEHRFFYVMPYHEGDHLGIITRQLHGESDGKGLGRHQLAVAFGYVEDLLRTLSRYHRGGLWHKDVKPDNIIVYGGRAHLVDLGLVTPLRSAMTLTTHGTEYFRDPEMVRMALRGVKVHQVDGAKFDIYAAGAVLYFVVENTFPAHGGLSAFGKRSPEALRWIIRRGMADYNKRYETARQMLDDIEHVSRAADPFAVKPAELPSMRAGGAAEYVAEPMEAGARGETVAAAGSPRPPKDVEIHVPGAGVQPDPDKAEVRVAGWGVIAGPSGIKVGNLAPESVVRVAPRRPKIRLTNWWTGAYKVDDPGPAAASEAVGDQEALRRDARLFREQSRGLRQQTESLQRRVRNQRMSARRAAREQIRAARARAKEMRRRARAHRHRSVSERPPSAALGLMALAVLAFAAIFVLTARRSHQAPHVSIDDGVTITEVVPMPYSLQVPLATSKSESPLALLLVNDHPAAANPLVAARVEKIVQDHRDRGWIVVIDDQDAEVAVRKYLPTGSGEVDEPLPPLLHKTFIEHELGGVLQITTTPGEGEPHERFTARVILQSATEASAPPEG